MIDVSELMIDPDFVYPETLPVLRRDGQTIDFKFQYVESTIDISAVVQPASSKDVVFKANGDAIKAEIALWGLDQLRTTELDKVTPGKGHIGDKIYYQGEYYNVISSKPWKSNGYWKSLATRMRGA